MSVYRLITGLSEIAGDYDLLLCDVFGTLHDAEGTFPPALDALARFRRGGGCGGAGLKRGRVGRWADPHARGRGIADVSDGLVSAGDVTRAVLRERRPDSILYIGSERDRRVIDGVSAGRGGAGADLIVCTGYPEDDADLDDILGEAHRRGVPMLCTNPDTSLVAGGRLLRFSGLVAERYRELGGAVTETASLVRGSTPRPLPWPARRRGGRSIRRASSGLATRPPSTRAAPSTPATRRRC